MLLTNNKQELFNLALVGVVAQGGPAMGFDGCTYQNEDGKRCAASHCMTDEMRDFAIIQEADYVVDFESLSEAINDDDSCEIPVPNIDVISFVEQLQMVHDQLAVNMRENNKSDDWFIEHYKTEMKDFATKHKLITS